MEKTSRVQIQDLIVDVIQVCVVGNKMPGRTLAYVFLEDGNAVE